MKAAIMQPYIFPYIGYFQLISAADTFVIYDDVQYITRGWINRNRILQNGQENLFTFSLENDSSRKNINERFFTPDFSAQCDEFLKVIQFAYGNAPYFERTRELIEEVFEGINPGNPQENIGLKIGRSLQIISNHLGIGTNFIWSSNLEKDTQKSGPELIIEINNVLGADTYINPINGKELYRKERFSKKGLHLLFLEPQKIEYEQFSDDFIPWLSIIDVCMFNDQEEISELLGAYTLVG